MGWKYFWEMLKPYQYRYLKNPPKILKASWAEFYKRPVWPLLSILAGTAVLVYFFTPTLSYLVKNGVGRGDFKPPTSQNVQGVSEQGIFVQKEENFSYFVSRDSRLYPYQEFRLSVPKLKIEDAKVTVNSLEFKKSLAHLPGSALPGEVGNIFITGHSLLSQFFDPENYLTIFSTLPELEVGDQIIVEAAGIVYDYQVVKVFAVDPSDLSVIASPDNANKYLSLMTCVPVGIGNQRLIVLAKGNKIKAKFRPKSARKIESHPCLFNFSSILSLKTQLENIIEFCRHAARKNKPCPNIMKTS